MTTTDTTAAPVAAPGWGLRIFVIVFAALETLSGLMELPGWFDLPQPSPGFELSQYFGNAYQIVHPPLAALTLILALFGRVRGAIIALAVMVLANWLSDIPGAFIHGLEIAPGLFGKLPAMKYFGYPVIGIAALWLAWRNTRLWIAAILSVVPTAAQIVGVVGFAIGVMIYGF